MAKKKSKLERMTYLLETILLVNELLISIHGIKFLQKVNKEIKKELERTEK